MFFAQTHLFTGRISRTKQRNISICLEKNTLKKEKMTIQFAVFYKDRKTKTITHSEKRILQWGPIVVERPHRQATTGLSKVDSFVR